MKRKSNYNIRHKKGGKSYKEIPEKKRNPRLRPVASADFGAALVDDPAMLFFYTLAFVIPFYIIKNFVL